MSPSFPVEPSHPVTTASQSSSKKRRRKQRPPKLDPDAARIVIVGAGLAGLSAAIALTQAGFKHVTVYERDPSLDFQKEGYGLTLTYNPKGPLAALGILEQVACRDCPSRSHYLFRASDGLPLGYFGNAFFPQPEVDDENQPRRGQGQRGNLRVPRKILRKILYEKLIEEDAKLLQDSDATAVNWDHRLDNLEWDATKQQYTLTFQKGTQSIHVPADLLLAADGIRSTILQNLYIQHHQRINPTSLLTPQPTIQQSPEWYGLRPMGIRLILGIAEFDSSSVFPRNENHPLQLLNERGFYTLDGQGRRLFTMPYQSNRFAKDQSKVSNRIMWQLSFPTAKNHGDREMLDAMSLQKHVLDTCQLWHEPVLDLIQATPIETIWGTDLMDRDPRDVYDSIVCGKQKSSNPQFPRLAVLGDALHSMSPFKGQGANQALADGPLLAQWLQKSATDAAVSGWWRETLDRIVPVVEASRKAAQQIHSRQADLGDELTNHERKITIDNLHGFAGIKPEAVPMLVEYLRRRNCGANLGRKLDSTIYALAEENGWFQVKSKGEDNLRDTKQWQQEALRYATEGDTQGLRQMSLVGEKCSAIFSARDSLNRTCLHLAVLNNQLATSAWLLVELQCCVDAPDSNEKTAYDYCVDSDDTRVGLLHIFHVLREERHTRTASDL